MKPLQISPETAQKLAKQLNVPLEHLMHMPQHILMQKLAELAKSASSKEETDGGSTKQEP
ncbi:YycC family protein [Paenibacillus sp. OAS669]|uniref:YycC family protein n=1 Tax=Paenibacillus sp. OAS669 TaxID=2663821 RepID=UPI001788EA22|nr:YycC family protein [Paenibacillus sp. OAS669]MBE1444387.1 Asp-tRNA(Asn)/Glu-tRNA(Gln) amidotransferase C subunit [Paenibacillus sp. OAS669]